MKTSYTDLRFRSGLTDTGGQKHRNVSVRSTAVDYVLPETSKVIVREDEETGRTWDERVVVRPQMNVQTIVTCVRNQFGIVRLYGTQGVK